MADGRVLGVVSGLALLVGVARAVVWVSQRRLIYFPLLQDLPPVRSSLPGAEEVTFETADGVRLGRMVPGRRCRTWPGGARLQR